MRILMPIAAVLIAAPFVLAVSGAHAASAVQKECSDKWKAAKAANTTNGMKYNEFYKQCAAAAKTGGATPAAAPTPAPAPAAPTQTTAPAPAPAPAAPTTTAAKPAPAPAAPVSTGGIVFPAAISPQFSTLKPHDARMKTCAAQWQANKSNGGNGTMKWTVKGGGYYSECNKRLKG